MTARERMQLSYELAFFPPRLNQFCGEMRSGFEKASETVLEALDDALLLHQALPSRGYGSQRALERLAMYQAKSRAYAMPVFIEAVRQKAGRPPLTATEVPGRLVRDIALPVFARTRK